MRKRLKFSHVDGEKSACREEIGSVLVQQAASALARSLAGGLEQTMDFWPAYFKESLGEPWVIQPEGQQSTAVSTLNEPQQAVVFLTTSLEDGSLQEMMEKMVTAIKLNLNKVSFEFIEPILLSEVALWSSPKKIMIFGKEFSPLHFGQKFMMGPHQVMVTHSLSDLKNQPELKKETWEHLKNFARTLSQ